MAALTRSHRISSCTGYLSNNMYSNAIDLFETMSVEPDGLIIAMLFEACGKLRDDRATRLGNNVLRRLSPALLEHEKVTKSAVAMLIKFNELVNAERLFAQTTKKTMVAYVNMMQSRCRQASLSSTAFLSRLRGQRPLC